MQTKERISSPIQKIRDNGFYPDTVIHSCLRNTPEVNFSDFNREQTFKALRLQILALNQAITWRNYGVAHDSLHAGSYHDTQSKLAQQVNELATALSTAIVLGSSAVEQLQYLRDENIRRAVIAASSAFSAPAQSSEELVDRVHTILGTEMHTGTFEAALLENRQQQEQFQHFVQLLRLLGTRIIQKYNNQELEQ